MIKTVRGGKVIWITREEMNRILAKNRNISPAKCVQRRAQAEDGVSSEINRRVHTCRILLDAIRKAAPNEAAELGKKLRDLETVQNRSLSLGREVRMLEMAIQRRKSEDPILRDMDRATDEMLDALENQDLAEADICRTHCDRHAEEYLIKLKRLEPYLNKAREYRTQFVIEKRKLYQFEFEIPSLGEKILSAQIPEILYRDKEGEVSQKLVSLAESVRCLVAQGRPALEVLTSRPVEELESQNAAFLELDRNFLTPLFDKTMEFVNAFREAWSHFVDGYPVPSSEGGANVSNGENKGDRTSKGMVYPGHEKEAG
jgi:hypothetical protein